MGRKIGVPWEQEQAITDALSAYKYKCQNCGHPEFIRYSESSKVCKFCGHLVFKNSLDWFKYYLTKTIVKGEIESEYKKRRIFR